MYIILAGLHTSSYMVTLVVSNPNLTKKNIHQARREEEPIVLAIGFIGIAQHGMISVRPLQISRCPCQEDGWMDAANSNLAASGLLPIIKAATVEGRPRGPKPWAKHGRHNRWRPHFRSFISLDGDVGGETDGDA